jgi:two-component system sensor histidine kinase DegS
MINDFLKKYQEELISEKIQLKEDMDLLETKIKEETKFLTVLENSNESYFVEFTPRDINAKNNQKAAEVREVLDNLNKEMNVKVQQMKFYDGRLMELSNLLSESAKKSFSSQNSITEESIVDSNNDMDKNACNLKDTLSNIKNLVVLDPYRAQLELDNLISSI